MSWVRVAALDALTFAPGAAVTVGEREFAVFPTPTSASPYRAIPNACPHAGAALHDGDQTGTVVACLWHGWRFDLESGACLTDADDGLPSYAGRVVDGQLELDL